MDFSKSEINFERFCIQKVKICILTNYPDWSTTVLNKHKCYTINNEKYLYQMRFFEYCPLS